METHLKDQYGFNQFRSAQKDAVQAVLDGKDTIVIFPTGGGKSLCYQFPATYLKQVTVVVSPLISLMTDQQHALEQRGIGCISLNSTTNHSMIDICTYPDLRMIYCTPEYIANNSEALAIFKSLPVCLFAIDEAHCLSEWGHDFRPSYRKLSAIKKNFPDVPVAAFTATATPVVVQDIASVLGLVTPREFRKSSNRSNLKLSVMRKKSIDSDLLPHLRDSGQSVIIYVKTRAETEKICDMLVSNGINAEKYHGGMSATDRHRNHTNFIKDVVRVLVATISFGMGIDKPDIRTVIVYGAPSDLETYYQEVGRAGRDGMPSNGIMYHGPNDANISRLLISKGSTTQVKYRNGLLDLFGKFIKSKLCRQYMIDHYFRTGQLPEQQSNEPSEACNCDNCSSDSSAGSSTSDVSSEGSLFIKFVDSLQANYGANKLISTLRGSNSSSLSRELAGSSYHGKGSHRSVEWWKALVELLLEHKYLGYKLWKSKYQLITAGSNRNIAQLGSIPVPEALVDHVDQSALEQLTRFRTRAAEVENVAPYMIVNDKVLSRIALIRPTTVSELNNIDGVATEFALRYSKQITDIFKGETRIGTTRAKRTPRKSGSSSSAQESMRLFQEGQSVSDICSARGLSVSTVQNHLCSVWEGSPENMDCERIGLTTEVYDEIVAAVGRVGTDKLRPIKDLVSANTSYLHIKAALILLGSS